MYRHRLALGASLALLAFAPAAAQADLPRALPAVERTLAADRTTSANCATDRTAARRGIARTTWTAPMSGFVTARTTRARGDWDLALIDAGSRRAVATSQGFGGKEVAQAWVQAGQRLVLQGCRHRGASRTAAARIRFFDAAPPSGGPASLVRLENPSEHVLAWLDAKGLDVTHNTRQGFADVIVPDAGKLAVLDDMQIPYEVRERDLGAFYAQSRAADLRYSARVANSPLPTGRTGYRQYADYQTELKQITDENPGLARPVVIGTSFQGREMQGVELAANVDRKDDGRPTYFLMGLHHAREWPSAEIAMEFAWMLAKGYGSDPRITDLLKRERVVVVPIINPDGFFASRAAASDGMFPDPADTTGAPFADTAEGVAVPFGGNLAYRRKNCHGPVPSFGGAERDYPCYYQWGVDPNRNYGQGWGGPGASPDPNTQVFRGDGQWSEPETQAVHAYSQEHPVTAMISLHNVAALVLRPPGLHTGGKAPDEHLLRSLGNAMADVTGYTSQFGYQLYDTSGTTEDWNYFAAGTLGYTIEIGPLNGKFHMPYETGVVNEWVGPPVVDGEPDGPRKGGMREALLLAAEGAADPAGHSVLTGSSKGGNVLRLKKEFETESSPVCTFAQGYVRAGTVPALDCIGPGETRSTADKLEYTTVVPPKGGFAWHVTPSTRPFIGGRYVDGDPTAWTQTFTGDGLQAPAKAGAVEREFVVTDDDFTRDLDLKLDWTVKTEDYNLNLYYVRPDGSRVGIGTAHVVDGVLVWTAPGRGQNPNGVPEHITVQNAPAGKYVAEIVNVRAAVADDWTLTVNMRGQKDGHTEPTGVTESWTLTCEKADGTVLATREVTVARGQSLAVGDPCKKPKKGK